MKFGDRLGGNPAPPDQVADLLRRMLPATVQGRAGFGVDRYADTPWRELPPNAQMFANAQNMDYVPEVRVANPMPPPRPDDLPVYEAPTAIAHRGPTAGAGPAQTAAPQGPYAPPAASPDDELSLVLAAMSPSTPFIPPTISVRPARPQQEQPFDDPAFEPRTTKPGKKKAFG